jgi:predicted transglutaminase-like cysteine proteinase
LKFQVEHISLETPALPAIGHTRFCAQYQDDCEVRGVDFRMRNIELIPERLAELSSVNRDVNREIAPLREDVAPAAESWQVPPRPALPRLRRHQAARTTRLRLAVSRAPVGGDHRLGQAPLVLMVRTKDVDIVLDNLNANVRPVAMTRYPWVRVVSPNNPKFWSTVSVPTEMRTAMQLAGREFNQPSKEAERSAPRLVSWSTR